MSEPDEEVLREILTHSPAVAVIGIATGSDKPAASVPVYLHDHGYRVFGINPKLAGTTVLGEPVRATLAEVREPIDVVDVFRRADAIPAHVPDILAMRPLPRVVWFQLGIRNDAAAAELEAAGIRVVQDRCMRAEHRQLGLGSPSARGPASPGAH